MRKRDDVSPPTVMIIPWVDENQRAQTTVIVVGSGETVDPSIDRRVIVTKGDIERLQIIQGQRPPSQHASIVERHVSVSGTAQWMLNHSNPGCGEETGRSMIVEVPFKLEDDSVPEAHYECVKCSSLSARRRTTCHVNSGEAKSPIAGNWKSDVHGVPGNYLFPSSTANFEDGNPSLPPDLSSLKIEVHPNRAAVDVEMLYSIQRQLSNKLLEGEILPSSIIKLSRWNYVYVSMKLNAALEDYNGGVRDRNCGGTWTDTMELGGLSSLCWDNNNSPGWGDWAISRKYKYKPL
ncbi:hypothetical protein K438DRAFT_1775996 [Mycena galopus ATCC 62051]|nr:hypothetical protein K438DRAFT_1775996 [Mycena galopus ATCC 62051]